MRTKWRLQVKINGRYILTDRLTEEELEYYEKYTSYMIIGPLD